MCRVRLSWSWSPKKALQLHSVPGTQEEKKVSGTYLHVAPAESRLDCGKRIPPDGQNEEYVNDDQPH